ncbi:CDI toxin immunity protein [Streptomyces sp. CAS3]
MNPEERQNLMILEKRESDDFEACSLNRFPHSAWEGIDWEEVAFVDQEFTSGEREAAEVMRDWLSRLTSSDSLWVIFWGNAVVPTVALPGEHVKRHAEEILYTSADVWLFSVDDQFLIEYTHDGRLTIARVPSG